jgi:YD repeat-containing protein
MCASSSALTEARRAAVIVVLLCASAVFASDWYVSDASGIALETSTSGRALKLDYGLSIDTFGLAETKGISGTKGPGEISGRNKPPAGAVPVPETVRAAVPVGGSIELRTLYEKGVVLRQRYTALDSAGNERFVETHEKEGGIERERYDALRHFVEEGRFRADGSGTVIRYTYSVSRLERAEAFSIAIEAVDGAAAKTTETPLWTETYQYMRSGALRSVERTPVSSDGKEPAKGATETTRFNTLQGVPRLLVTRSADGSSTRTRYDEAGKVLETATFDPSGKRISVAEVTTNVDAGETKTASIVKSTEADGTVVETGHDERGRVVSERRITADGAVLSETLTVWTKNRVASIETVAGGQTRRTEYEYDAAEKRTMERNYRNGVLERSVRSVGGEDTEELYSDGVPVLRAVWVGGRKVSEQRIRKGGETSR